MNVLATEQSREAEQPRQSSVWDYMSPSRLNLWLRCPLAFKLRYIDGIKTPTNTSMFLGTVVHAGLEHYYRHRQCGVSLSAEQVTKHLDQQWESLAENDQMTFASSEEESSLREQASRLVSTYLDQVPEDEASPLTVETGLQVPLIDPLSGEDLGIPLLGVVDLVLGGEDGPTVIDFKTASKSNNPVEIIHEVQLSAYSYLFRETAAACEGGLEIRSLIKTKTPKIVHHTYPPRTEQHLRRFFRLVRTSVPCRVFIADHTKCAHDMEITPEKLLADYNQIFAKGEQMLADYTTRVEGLSGDCFQILVINNSNIGFQESQPRWLGVLHQAVIDEPLGEARRIVNSTMIAPLLDGEPELISAEDVERFVATDELSKKITA